ncbi:alpha/beta hydrolase [Pararhodobacter sp. SW119]|uniref:alpha/beta hydrolase n=1 Tax=Pararhodobacter sp. SW119 TaxID=2780075 RepID=UPI001ADFD5CD|nr:alpha/beta hydrolase [Pararhodobacter sp. SW119]
MDATEDLSLAYANADFIPSAADYPPRWRAEAAAFRDALGGRARCGLAYGPGARQVFDLFLPEGRAKGLLVFIHGGYWLAFAPGDWSAFAAGALARGWAVALPGYTLAPEARIRAMTDEIEAAIGAAAMEVDGPVVVTGHSAGGHLSARMACADRSPEWADRLARVVPISPLADLRPLMRTGMNAKLALDPDEAAAESPALRDRRPGVEVRVWVGAQERPAFLWQARLLSEAWDCPWHAEPGRHHFDVIDGLRDPESPLMRCLLDGI